jgi:hypothetical protein
MLAKLLGAVDLGCAMLLAAASYIPINIVPSQLTMFFGMILFAKGIVFTSMGNSISILDALAGLYMGLMVYGFSNYIVTGFFIIFLAQKGLLSLLAR